MLPTELIEYLQGNIVLFWGCDIPSDYFSGKVPPSREELAHKLSTTLENVEEVESLEQVAERYELEFGRHRLVQQLLELLNDINYKPQELHRLIAQLPLEAIVTTSQDELLEQAFKDVGRKWTTVLSPINLPFVDIPKQASGGSYPMIIKVRGTVSQPNSLVLTREDHFYMQKRLGKLFDIIRYLFVLRPLMVLGHNPRDTELRTLYTEATDGIVKYQRRAFIIWREAFFPDKQYWIQKNVQILDLDPVTVLQEANHIRERLRHIEPTSEDALLMLHKDPYKFLAHYDPEDTDIFFGRETETKILFQFILSRKLVILFGESGVGKTSLLRAGIMPKLWNENYKIAYTRVYEAPLVSIHKAILETLDRDFNSSISAVSRPDLSLFYFFNQEDKLIIILDQFEEIFLYLAPSDRERVYQEIEQFIQHNEYEIRIVLIIRQDFFPLLFEGLTITQYLQGNTYRLTSLSQDKAYLALNEPAARVGVQVEAELADILLSEKGLLDKVTEKISPASLQIVCDRLYQEALSENGGERIGAIMTAESYRSLGGVEMILAEYMEFVLAKLPKEEISYAREILKVMVTSKETKKAINSVQLESILNISPVLKTLPEHIAYMKVVNRLIEQRLLRTFEKDGEVVYELMHDHMAKLISDWMSELEVRTKAVYELLQRELESWRQFGAIRLIENTTLTIIDEYRDTLWYLGSDELKLICLSSLANKVECTYWVQRAQEAKVLNELEQELITEVLESPTPNDSILRLSRINTSSVCNRLIALSNNEFQELSIDETANTHQNYTILDVKTTHHKRILSVLAKMTNIKAIEYLSQLASQELILIPAGEFDMGSTEYPVEGPIHSVWLDSFYIRKNLVRNSEYAEFIKVGGYENPEYWTKEGWAWLQQANRKHPDRWKEVKRRAKHPVVGVSWFESYAFASWAGGILPSEAQWEKAASFDPKTRHKYRYPWGNEFYSSRCNTNANQFDETTPVGYYSPDGDSIMGCSDMAGNVWEWCSSIFGTYPYRIDDGREEAEAQGVLRVMRGGSYKWNPILARCSARLENGPSRSAMDLGMRYVTMLVIG